LKKEANPLTPIKNISSLEELAVFHTNIQTYSKMIMGVDYQHREDIVSDFYLKMHKWWNNNPGKTIHGGFVASSLHNAFKNKVKAKKYIIDQEFIEEDHQEVIDSLLKDKIKDEIILCELDDIINTLHWYERAVLLYSYDIDLKTIAKETGISYKSLRITMQNIKLKIKNTIDGK
jgi:DNA-directed RNA polymerase specialized sigma24 family protein